MSKTPKKKTKKAPVKPATPPLPPVPSESPNFDDEEKRFDFGGLPKRDLKKNLGCG